MAKVLLVISSQNFRDEELFETKAEIEKAGHKTVIGCSSLGEAKGMLGKRAIPEVLLENVAVGEFEAIVFVGGGGAATYYNNRFALGLAKKFFSSGKIVAAICIAPMILANAGILKGKNATISPSEEHEFKEKGANYTGTELEIDGKIITAAGPRDSKEFGKAIAKMLPK